MNNKYKKYGTPFIAAFNKESGSRIFFSLINMRNKSILDFKLVDNVLYLLFRNRIAIYSLENGTCVAYKNFSKKEFGNLQFFVGNNIYFSEKKDYFYPIVDIDTSKLVVLTSSGKNLWIDKTLHVDKTLDNSQLFSAYKKSDDYMFLSKSDTTYIINREGNLIAELKASIKASLIGNCLYDKHNDSIISIDLSGILKDK